MLLCCSVLNGKAVPSSLECPQVVKPRGIYKSGSYSPPLGLREGHRQNLGRKTCSHNSIHMHSVVPATGVIPALPSQLLQELQWDRKGKSPEGQPYCLERENRGQWPTPSPAAPPLLSRGATSMLSLPHRSGGTMQWILWLAG